MLSARPIEMSAISAMTHEARLINVGRCRARRRVGGFAQLVALTRFHVLLAVAMTRLTFSCTGIVEEGRALTMSVQRKRLHNQSMTLLAVLADDLLLAGLTRDGSLGRLRGRG